MRRPGRRLAQRGWVGGAGVSSERAGGVEVAGRRCPARQKRSAGGPGVDWPLGWMGRRRGKGRWGWWLLTGIPSSSPGTQGCSSCAEARREAQSSAAGQTVGGGSVAAVDAAAAAGGSRMRRCSSLEPQRTD